MNQSHILTLDIGTSSIRAALYDACANEISGAFAKVERTLIVTADGGAEIDADEAVEQVAIAVDAVLEKTSKTKIEIEYIASCSFWHSLVGVDAKGKPTTKVFGWADTRGGKYTDVLKQKFDERVIHNRTGAHFHSSFWPAKLLWLRKDFPDVFANTTKWLSFSDYIALKLFGELTTSVSMASGTGMFDIRKCEWDAELLKFLKLKPGNMATVVASDDDTFRLIKKSAVRWPRLAKSKWFLPYADGAADSIGAGAVTTSQAALMVGTSAAMRVAYVGEPPEQIPDGLWCYRIDRKRVILGGALSDGGGLYYWIKENLRLPKDADNQIASRVPGSHRLTFMPFLAGERSTRYHEGASGSILGLTSATSPVDILQAALESVAYRFAEIFDRLNSVVEIDEIVASGGALRDSSVWTQIIADVLGRDMTVNRVSESSSRGVSLLALESIGKIKLTRQNSNKDGDLVMFDRSRHDRYKKLRERHQEKYHLLTRQQRES